MQGGKSAPQQSNIENLLDIDFDGSAPASSQETPGPGLSGLEGLAGTPQRAVSPVSPGAPAGYGSNMDDLMGLGDMSGGSGMGSMSGMNGGMNQGAGTAQSNQQDMMDGFAGLDMSGNNQSTAGQQTTSSGQAKKTNEDLLGLF